MSELSPPHIVCAACRDQSSVVIPSARHFDPTMHAVVKALRNPLSGLAEQGFIDQHGVFYTRTEAWKIAETNGQIRRRVGGDDADGGTLYSENLY